jgi:hypothetical protein
VVNPVKYLTSTTASTWQYFPDSQCTDIAEYEAELDRGVRWKSDVMLECYHTLSVCTVSQSLPGTASNREQKGRR